MGWVGLVCVVYPPGVFHFLILLLSLPKLSSSCTLIPSRSILLLLVSIALCRFSRGGGPRSRLAAFASHAAVRLVAYVDASGGTGLVLGVVDESLLDIGGEGVESLVDVDVALRRDLEEGDAELVGEGLALLFGDDALVLPVALVADEDLVDALGGVLLYVLEPGADV